MLFKDFMVGKTDLRLYYYTRQFSKGVDNDDFINKKIKKFFS